MTNLTRLTAIPLTGCAALLLAACGDGGNGTAGDGEPTNGTDAEQNGTDAASGDTADADTADVGGTDAGWAVFEIGDEEFRVELQCYGVSDGFHASTADDAQKVAPEGIDLESVHIIIDAFGDESRASGSHGSSTDGSDTAVSWAIGAPDDDRGNVTSLEEDHEALTFTIAGEWEQTSWNSPLERGILREGTMTAVC